MGETQLMHKKAGELSKISGVSDKKGKDSHHGLSLPRLRKEAFV